MRYLCLSISILLVQTGCTNFNPVTAMRLATLNPLTLSPYEVGAIARYPDEIRVIPDSFILVLKGTNEITQETLDETFVLTPSLNSDFEQWQFDDETAERLEDTRKLIVQWKQSAGSQASGTLSVQASFCQIAPPPPNSRFSIEIKPSNDIGFLTLIRDKPISPLLQDVEGALTECVD